MAITTITSPILGVDNEILEQLLADIGLTVVEIRPWHIVGVTPVPTEVDIDGTIVPPLLTDAQNIVDNHISFKDSNVRLFGRDQVIIGTTSIGNILFNINGVSTWEINTNGHLIPTVGSARNIGSVSNPVQTIYADEVIGGSSGITLPNDIYLESRDNLDTTDLGLVKANTSDNTEVNTVADGDLLFTEDGNLVGQFTQTVHGYALEVISEANTAALPLSGGSVVIPNTAGNRSGYTFRTDAGGQIGGIVGHVVTPGADNVSVGRLDAVVASTTSDFVPQSWYHDKVEMKPSSLVRWTFDSSGQFVQDATNGDDILFQRSGTGLDTNAIDLEFRVSGSHGWSISNSDTDLEAQIDGLAIRQNTNDKHLWISGGAGVADANGARIALHGTTSANVGRMDLAGGTGGRIQFITSGFNRWYVDVDGSLNSNSNHLIFSGSGIIRGTSLDGTDTATLTIVSDSGGAADPTRGGSVRIAGNDGANSGKVILQAGNVPAGSLDFYTGTELKWSILNNGDLVGTNVARIHSTVDNQFVAICGGAASSAANGAKIDLMGNSSASFAGELRMGSSNDSTGGVLIYTSASSPAPIRFAPAFDEAWHIEADGDFIPQTTATYDIGSSALRVATNYSREFNSANATVEAYFSSGTGHAYIGTVSNHPFYLFANNTRRWDVETNGDFSQDSTNGGDLVFNKNLSGVRQGTADASDSNSLEFSGGGAFRSTTRGAYISLHGNEHGTRPGDVNIVAGAGGELELGNSTHSAAWKIDTSSHLIPQTNGSQDIGSATNHVRDIYFTGTLSGGGGILLGNNQYLQARNFADDGNLDLLKASNNDDTVLNTGSNKDIIFAEGGSANWTINGLGTFFPASAGGQNIGTTANYVANVYSRRFIAPTSLNMEFYADNAHKLTLNTNGALIFQTANADIFQNTSDGSDNARTRIGGGGDVTVTRGAMIEARGNEYVSQGGTLFLDAGNITTGDVFLRTWHADGEVSIRNSAGNQGWRVTTGADGHLRSLHSEAQILTNTTDGTDNGSMILSSANALGTSRGASLSLYGNEHSSFAGDAFLTTGNISGSALNLQANASDGTIIFRSGGSDKWTMDEDGHIVPVVNATYKLGLNGSALLEVWAQSVLSGGGLTLGTVGNSHIDLLATNTTRWRVDFNAGNFVGMQTANVIRTNTADASDTGSLSLTGAGGVGSTRGASIELYGNEHTEAGAVSINAGDVSGGTIDFYTGNAKKWIIDRPGNFVPNLNEVYNIGSTSLRVNEIHAKQIGSSGNEVDDIWVTNLHATSLLGTIALDNDTYLQGRNNADDADIDLLKVSASDNTVLNALTGKAIQFRINDTEEWSITSSGHFIPLTNNTNDIGNASQQVASVHAVDYNSDNGAVQAQFKAGPSTSEIGSLSNHGLSFFTNNITRWSFSNAGHMLPATDSTYDIGSGVVRVRTIYADTIDATSLVGTTSFVLPNNTFFQARNNADDDDLDLLKADSGDNTILNALTGELLRLQVGESDKLVISNTDYTFSQPTAIFSGTTTTIRKDTTAGQMTLSGGNSGDATDGAILSLFGNTHAVQAGNVTLASGPAGDITLLTSGAASKIRFSPNNPSGTSVVEFHDDGSMRYGNNTFTIHADTSDGSDSKQLRLFGGGSVGAARGAGIRLYGNEAAGTPGEVFLEAGDVAGGIIRFNTAGVTQWRIENSGGHFVGLQTSSTIRTNANSRSVFIAGGTSTSTANGAYIGVYGNTHSTSPGRVLLRGGNVAGTEGIDIETTHSDGDITFQTNSITRWEMPGSEHSLVYFNEATIRANTSDGSDNLSLKLTGGGSNGASRGSQVTLYGNEHVNNGSLDLQAGVSGAVNIDGGGTASPIIMGTLSANASSGALTTIQSNWANVTSNQTAFQKVLEIEQFNVPIASGITESGYRIGIGVQAFINNSAFQGTLDELYGIWCRTGSNTTNPTGTINTEYGLYLESLSGANVTVNNKYAIYQSATDATNLFNGPMQFNGISTYSANVEFTPSNWVISANTSDGSDSKAVSIAGGGTDAATRGAYIKLHGNENASNGALALVAGDNSSIQFYTGGAGSARWQIDGSGHIVPGTDSTFDIGSNSNKVRELFVDQITGVQLGLAWTEVTGTSQSMSVESGYISNNASLVTLTLPSTVAVGQRIRVAGYGAGGWKIAQNSGQTIHFGTSDTTTGASGSLDSNNRYDAIELVCTVANTNFVVISSVGNITVN